MSRISTRALLVLAVLCTSPSSQAFEIGVLTIEGIVGPGAVGHYPANAAFSWIDHRYPSNTLSHIWQLAPGSDGGIMLGQAQPNAGELTEVRPMYNQDSWLYTIGSGITLTADKALDFSNLFMSWGGTILALGAHLGFDPFVPLVADITQLSNTANGYAVYADASYDLIYHSAGLCNGCELTLHFHGNASPVPEPKDTLLWLTGLALLYGNLRRKSEPSKY
jgi:hypothetical protein